MSDNQPLTKQLLLGCGISREKKLRVPGTPLEFQDLTTVDFNPDVKPDVLHDLNITPWPFADNSYDEIHAYEVLEHLGQQGDYESFFATFEEIYRILKPGGFLLATTPRWDSVWAWGDPGHTRIISEGSLVFLDQTRYGRPPMTDYRGIYKGDLRVEEIAKTDHHLLFILKKYE